MYILTLYILMYILTLYFLNLLTLCSLMYILTLYFLYILTLYILNIHQTFWHPSHTGAHASQKHVSLAQAHLRATPLLI